MTSHIIHDKGRSQWDQNQLKAALNLQNLLNEDATRIEEAASKTGVGTKTWRRYESGQSIRKDKYKGVCRALNWHSFPKIEVSHANDSFDLGKYQKHEAWSPYLMHTFGTLAAVSFVVGSDILLDNLAEDLDELSSLPRGSHVGELDGSWMAPILPSQFLMKYDYDFLYVLLHTVKQLRITASTGNSIVAHSVIEELTLYLIVEESRLLIESMVDDMSSDLVDQDENWDEWIFDLFDDMDLVTFLYSDFYLDTENTYHFDHWLERQFYCDADASH